PSTMAASTSNKPLRCFDPKRPPPDGRRKTHHRGTEAQRRIFILFFLLCASVPLWFIFYPLLHRIRPMLKVRIIPCLHVQGGRVVEGVPFLDLVGAGDPVEQAAISDAAGADELCFLDITASAEERDTLYDVVARTAEQCFMPLTVGGGVRKLEDIRKLLLAGADKVSINTAAVATPEFVREAAEKFGAQCIVVAIDVKETGPGCWG